jgi:LysM repeat protein
LKALVIIFLTAAIFGGAYFATWKLYLKPQEALRAEKARGPASPPPDPTLPEFNKQLTAQDTQTPLEAREKWTQFIERYPESSRIDEAKDYLGRLNIHIYLAPIPSPEKTVYVVKSGDVITIVAKKFKTTPELLMRANSMTGSMLRIGQKLMIPPSEFSITISRRQKRVTLLNKGKFFKQYAILAMPVPKGAAANPKGPTPRPPKIAAHVADRIAWVRGQRVNFTDKEYGAADYWVMIVPGGHSLYCEIPPPPGAPAGAPPAHPIGGGYLMAAPDVREMAALLKKNDPVTID